MAKDSFILYLDQQEIFEMLTDEEAGQLIKAIFEYEDTGNIRELDKSLQIAFIPIKSALDRNKEKYNKVVERNKKNIEKRWNKENTKNTTGKTGIPKDTKNTDNDNERDSEHDSERDNEHETTTVVNNISDSCNDGFKKIIDFYNENVGSLTPYGLTLLEDYLKDFPSDVIIYAMQISVEADKRSIKYIKAILNNWLNTGIKTLVEAQKENQSFKNTNTNKTKKETAKEEAERLRKEWGLSDED